MLKADKDEAELVEKVKEEEEARGQLRVSPFDFLLTMSQLVSQFLSCDNTCDYMFAKQVNFLIFRGDVQNEIDVRSKTNRGNFEAIHL